MASVILDFYDEDAPSTLLGSLEDDDLESLEHRPTLFDIGALVFRVPKATADANTTLLRKTNIVRVRYPTPTGSTRVWAGVLKDTKSVVVSTKEQHGEYVEWTAPGILYMLSYGSLGTASTVSDQPARGSFDDVPARDWIWLNEPYGAILTRLIEEGRHSPFPDAAEADSPLEDVTIDFDRTTDSNGNAWANIAEEFRVPIGANMLDVAARLATAGDLFLVMDPDLELHAYQQYSDFATDRTGSFGAGNVRWEKGVNILTELSRSSQALQLTHLIQRDSDGNSSTEVASGYTSGKEHWGYSESDSTNDDTTLNKIAQRAIGASGQDAEQIAFEVTVGNDEAAGDYFPFLHYDPGDLVTVDTGSGGYDLNEASLRVVGVRITLDEASKSTTAAQAYRSLHVVPELAYRPIHTFTTNRSISGDPGATPGCVCSRLCQRTVPPGDPTPGTEIENVFWDWETSTLDSTNTYNWMEGRYNSPGALSGWWGWNGGGDVSESTKIPIGAGVSVTLTGSFAKQRASTVSPFSMKLRWFSTIGSVNPFVSSTIAIPASGSGPGVIGTVNTTIAVPTGATYVALFIQDNVYSNDVRFIVTGTPTPGTDGIPGSGVEELVGTVSCVAHGDHRHTILNEEVPTATDDAEHGYPATTTWIVVDDADDPTELVAVYVSVSDANGAAVWTQIYPTAANGITISDGGDPIQGVTDVIFDGATVAETGDNQVTVTIDIPDLTSDVVSHGSMGASEDFDVTDGTDHEGTLDANLTVTLSGAVAGEAGFMTLVLTQDSGGGNTLTLPGSVPNAAEIEAAFDLDANAVNILTVFSYDGGTTWFAFLAGGAGTAVALGHWEVEMAEGITDPPDPVTTEDGGDWVYGWVTD